MLLILLKNLFAIRFVSTGLGWYKLASYATWWANQRCQNCLLTHSTGPYGEDLFREVAQAGHQDLRCIHGSQKAAPTTSTPTRVMEVKCVVTTLRQCGVTPKGLSAQVQSVRTVLELSSLVTTTLRVATLARNLTKSISKKTFQGVLLQKQNFKFYFKIICNSHYAPYIFHN